MPIHLIILLICLIKGETFCICLAASDIRDASIENPLRLSVLKKQNQSHLTALSCDMVVMGKKEGFDKSARIHRKSSHNQAPQQTVMEDHKKIGILKHQLNTCLAINCGGFVGAYNYIKDDSRDSKFSGCRLVLTPCVCVRDCAAGLMCGPGWFIFGPCTNQDTREDLDDIIHGGSSNNSFFELLFINLCFPCCC